MIRFQLALFLLLTPPILGAEAAQKWVASFSAESGTVIGVTSASPTKETFAHLSALVKKGLSLNSFTAVKSVDYKKEEKDLYTFRYVIGFQASGAGIRSATYSRGGFATSVDGGYEAAMADFEGMKKKLAKEYELVSLETITIIRERLADKAARKR